MRSVRRFQEIAPFFGTLVLGALLFSPLAQGEGEDPGWSISPLPCESRGHFLTERLALRDWPAITMFLLAPEYAATLADTGLMASELLRLTTVDPESVSVDRPARLPSFDPPPVRESPAPIRTENTGGIYSIEVLNRSGVPTLTLRGGRDSGLERYVGEVIAPGFHMRGYFRTTDGFAIAGSHDVEFYRVDLPDGPTLLALAGPSFRVDSSGYGTRGSIATETGLALEVPVERAPGPLRLSLVAGPEVVIRSDGASASGVVSLHAGGTF